MAPRLTMRLYEKTCKRISLIARRKQLSTSEVVAR